MPGFPDDALVRITFDSAGLIEAARQAGLRIDEARTQVGRANLSIAQKMQQAQLRFLRESIETTGRPQRPTQYLVRALESDAYIEADPDHFTVGTAAVLEDPQISPYWRGLEYGSSAHVGHTLYGYFRSIEGKKYPAMEERIREDPRLIQLSHSTPPGKRRRKGRQSFPWPITIHNPIPEYAFLRQGTEEVTPAIDQIYRDFIPGLR